MTIKSEFANAIKLFLLLSLLFWSLTWNSSEYFDSSSSFDREDFPADETGKTGKDLSISTSNVPISPNQPHGLDESVFAARGESGKQIESVPTAAISIPPFNEWKEREITKYEMSSSKDIDNPPRKSVPRKLNYASSKCGAKVLASNREARHRASVLSEKPDEYMLNPCRAKMWFIVELCDTVEATQFELANHELYSSSPKEFSVFWSEVYPTKDWHLLGTFEAKDQRSMQTFDLNVKKMMKFIKVVIYNHHGKEHYCPLSVIRVLGYSVVQKFEDIETSESSLNYVADNPSEKKIDKHAMFEKELNISENVNNSGENTKTPPTMQICSLYLMHCADAAKINADKMCRIESMRCRFLTKVMKSSTDCNKVSPSEVSKNPAIAIYEEKLKDSADVKNKSESTNDNSSFKGKSSYRDILKNNEQEICLEASKQDCGDKSDKNVMNERSLETRKSNSSRSQNFTNTSNEKGKELSVMSHLSLIEEHQQKCVCLEQGSESKTEVRKDTMSIDLQTSHTVPGDENIIESAGLIHTESVLFKLTSRIKALERDLNLINKYLQQLSQSYRQQMADMKVMFDQTLKIINTQSERAEIIDKNQEQSIRALEKKTKILNLRVDFLMNGQRDMLKRVIELHGFFLILELIVISTLFTIFLNIFHRKNHSVTKNRMKINGTF